MTHEVQHPGHFFVMALGAMGMTQAEFARRTGLSTKHVNFVCKGKVTLTAHVALLIEETLGIDAARWLQLQANYDLALAREARQKEIEAQRARQQAWIEKVAPAWLSAGAPETTPWLSEGDQGGPRTGA